MPRYRVDSIESLSRQLTFAPALVRAEQVAAAEDLLLEIDPAKGYPLDLIIFRITGYRPKADQIELLAGAALQHDLGMLVESVSDSLGVRTDSLVEPVLQIDDVCQRFNVTSKTIQRWRRRGLPARRFVFADGKRRVGFLLSRVERFVQTHQPQVQRGGDFSQVSPDERMLMVRRARRLATMCGCCVTEITRRLARKHHRSPLTVLHTIRKHDAECPAVAVFPLASPPVSDAEKARILKAYRRGVGIGTIARRSCRNRTAVYRVILDHRLDRLINRRIRFMDDPLYHQAKAGDAIRSIVEAAGSAVPASGDASRTDPARGQADSATGMSASLFRTPPLGPAMERALFLKLNYHKYRFVVARRKLDPELARGRDLDALERHLRRATRVRNTIVQANLRLVASVARKHLRPGVTLAELVSDGGVTLLRAVDGFDIHRGNRFSTYATLALMKGFARSVPQSLARRPLGEPSQLARVADPAVESGVDRVTRHDQVRVLLAGLEPDERDVLRARFGLDTFGQTATAEQVGRRLGMTPNRVRQVERQAMDRLRLSGSTG